MMMPTKLNGIVLITIIGMLPLCGCSMHDHKSEIYSDLWIWNFVDRPHADRNAADTFLEFFAFARRGCEHDKWRTGIELLAKIATSQESSIEVIIVREQVTGQKLYKWTFGDHALDGQVAKQTGECISDLVNICKSECDAQEMSELAAALLLVGYQLSKHGEDPSMATYRIGLWRMAVDLIGQSQESPPTDLLELAECLDDAFYAVQDWEKVELRYPGWEQCPK